MAREQADLVGVSYPVHGTIAAFSHDGAANSDLPLPAITGPRPESLYVYCKQMAKFRWIMQILAPFITSSCEYSSFLTRAADADADPKRFPWVKLRQTSDSYAHAVTNNTVAIAIIGVNKTT
jgi:hypothetical protein